jgi:tRNA pseudouridine55 synthase
MKNKGIIPINKPSGWTSFDVVNKIKYMVKPLKVGHLGTLDPMATGVLLVTVGKATKLFDIMQEKKKTYVAEFEFGTLTDTLDSTGEVLETQQIPQILKSDLVQILSCFEGEIMQIPPKYSAKSVNGVRAYTMARNNIDFELPAKKVNIYSIKLIDFDGKKLKIEIECGSGTYIRSLGRDIASKLNTIATMTSLVRTRVGNVNLNNCYEIENLNKDNVLEYVKPVNNFLDYKTLNLTQEQTFKVLNGQTLEINEIDGIYKLNGEIDTIALIEIKNLKAKMWLFLGE